MAKADERRAEFMRQMAQWYDGMVGRAGLTSGDSFDDIEEQAEERGRAFARALLNARLTAEEEAQPEAVRCPKCGRPMRRPAAAQRQLDTFSGAVPYARRHAICDRCAESFSPSGPSPANPGAGCVEPPAAQGL